MSRSGTEDLLELPALAGSAAGVTNVEPDEPAVLVDAADHCAEKLAIARELVRSARAHGVAMTGPEGMMKALTRFRVTGTAASSR